MRLFKEYGIILSMNIVSLVLGLWLYFHFGNKIEILTAILATGIAISIGIKQLKVEDDKMVSYSFYDI